VGLPKAGEHVTTCKIFTSIILIVKTPPELSDVIVSCTSGRGSVQLGRHSIWLDSLFLSFFLIILPVTFAAAEHRLQPGTNSAYITAIIQSYYDLLALPNTNGFRAVEDSG
jgi:hypothetical protein